MKNTKLLYYDRIDVSEGIDVNKTNKSKEYDISHYWYSLNKGFKFQTYFCNRSQDLLIIYINLSDIAILNIKGPEYCCIITGISKNQATNLMQNADLTQKAKLCKT